MRVTGPAVIMSICLLGAGTAASAPWKAVQQATGAPNAGRLLNASRLRNSAHIRLRFPKNAWGTRRMCDVIEQCARDVRKQHKRAHKLVVGDLSRQRGGHMPPHAGHRNGREADIGFYMRSGRPLDGLWRVGIRDIDARRTFTLLDCMLRSGDVLHIFVDRELQKPLHREAKRRGWSAAKLQQTFSYPRPRSSRVGKIQHRGGHDNHIHVRLRCASHERNCQDRPVARGAHKKRRPRAGK